MTDDSTAASPQVGRVLGMRLEAYYLSGDELLLRFEDGTILSWSGYHRKPMDVAEEGIREVVADRAEGEWIEA